MTSFLWICNASRRFTKGFTKVAKPLNELFSSTQPKKLPPPSGVQQKAFETLRDQLLNPPISSIPTFQGHYVLDVKKLRQTWLCAVATAAGQGVIAGRIRKHGAELGGAKLWSHRVGGTRSGEGGDITSSLPGS